MPNIALNALLSLGLFAPSGVPPECTAEVEAGHALAMQKKADEACKKYQAAFAGSCNGSQLKSDVYYGMGRWCRTVRRCDLSLTMYRSALARCQVEGCDQLDLYTRAVNYEGQHCKCAVQASSNRAGAVVQIRGGAPQSLPGKLMVGHGDTRLVGRVEGTPPLEKTVSCTSDEAHAVEFTFPKKAAPPPVVKTAPKSAEKPAPKDAVVAATSEPDGVDWKSPKIWGWTAIGVGALGLSVGTVYLFKASGHADDRDAALDDYVNADSFESESAAGRRFAAADDDRSGANTVAAVTLGIGGAAVVTGVVLLLLDEAPGDAVSVGIGPGTFGLSGHF